MVYFQTKKIHQTQDFGYDHFNLSSANISLKWHYSDATVALWSYMFKTIFPCLSSPSDLVFTAIISPPLQLPCQKGQPRYRCFHS